MTDPVRLYPRNLRPSQETIDQLRKELQKIQTTPDTWTDDEIKDMATDLLIAAATLRTRTKAKVIYE